MDEVVCFNTLDDAAFRAIARLMCDEYVPALKEKGMELTVTEEAITWLAENARGGKSAARDLRNLIRREVEDKLAQVLIDNAECPPEQVTVTVEDGKLSVRA